MCLILGVWHGERYCICVYTKVAINVYKMWWLCGHVVYVCASREEACRYLQTDGGVLVYDLQREAVLLGQIHWSLVLNLSHFRHVLFGSVLSEFVFV